MSRTEIQRVLDFWFAGRELDSPRVDSRMERWFGSDDRLDGQIRDEFGELVDKASDGKLEDWDRTPEGRLALIILLDQFRRHMHRSSADAFKRDEMALKICVEGIEAGVHEKLTPVQRLFFFIPMQHAESLPIQKKSVDVYRALADSVTETMRETFLTALHFAELHHDIVAAYGRFPHRNRVLRRKNTAIEATYLAGDSPSFGQE